MVFSCRFLNQCCSQTKRFYCSISNFAVPTEHSLSMVSNRWKTRSRWQTTTQLRAHSTGRAVVKPYNGALQIEHKRANSGLPKNRFSSKFAATEIRRFQQAGLGTHRHFLTAQPHSKVAQNDPQISFPCDLTRSKMYRSFRRNDFSECFRAEQEMVVFTCFRIGLWWRLTWRRRR